MILPAPPLAVQGVTVAYPNGHVAVRDVSFRLEAGMICALVGVNGSGKSTLFKTIMGFVTPTTGSVTIGGEPVVQAQRTSRLAYVPQAEEVDWTFPVTVREVVMMGRYGHMGFLRRPKLIDHEKVKAALARVEMTGLEDRQIGELSGGQKKRVFLARALAQEASLILLDEPFTGVDVKTEAAIVTLLRELRAQGHLIFISTHNLGAVPEFCTHAVILNRTVLAFGPLAEVFTEENLNRAFGGALRHFRVDQSTVGPHDGRSLTVVTDFERPLVLGKGGHLEFSDRREHEDLTRDREKPAPPPAP